MRKIKIVGILLLVIFLVAFIFNYLYVSNKRNEVVEKSIYTRYINNKNIKYAKGICNTKKQEVQYEDYIISLEEVIYDSETKLGYATIKYKKKDGKPYIKLDKWGGYYKGLVEERFIIEEHILEKDFRYIEDCLYEYICFETMDQDKTGIHILDIKQQDKRRTSRLGYEVCDFSIEEISNANIYTVDKNTKIYISPLAIMVKTNKKLNTINIKAFYDDGNSEVMIKASGDKESGMIGVDIANIVKNDEDEDKCEYLNILDSIINTNSIKYINFNGKKYYKDN